MKMSIVVPVYNAEKYLQECIQSVLNQTNPSWELVLVDDGSTDNSAEICDFFSNKYSGKIVSFHKQNEGEFLARQYGVKMCSGDYIGFLDADDLLDEEYIEILNKFIVEGETPDVVCFGFARFSENVLKKDLNIKRSSFGINLEMKDLYTKIASGAISGSMWSKVFKSDLFKNTLIDETVVSQKKFGPDAFHSFSLLFSAKSVVFIDDVLYYYRDNPQGASVGYGDRGFDYFNTKYVFELVEAFLCKNYSFDEDLFKKLYAHNFNVTVDHILKFYRNSKNIKRKRQLVKYDWTSYLLDETPKYIENNEYVRQSYIRVWKAFCDKNYAEIYVRERFKRFIGW